jgi:hypothetical protein
MKKTSWYVLLDGRNIQVIELTVEAAKELCALGPFLSRGEARRSQRAARRADEETASKNSLDVDFRQLHECIAFLMSDEKVRADFEDSSLTKKQLGVLVSGHIARLCNDDGNQGDVQGTAMQGGTS